MSDDKIHWYRTPVSKDKLRQLTQRSDRPGLIHILAQLGLYAATAIAACLAWYYVHWTVFIAALYIHCMLANFLVSALHEMIHQTPFKTKWLNEFFFKLVSFLIWINPIAIRITHLNHHQVTVFNGLDYENPMPRVYEPWHWFFFWTFIPFKMCFLGGFFLAVFSHVRVAAGSLKDYADNVFAHPDPRQEKQCIRWGRIIVFGHLLLIGVFLYLGLWPLILLINFSVFFAPGLGLAVGLTQHIGMSYNVPDFRLCARSIRLNPFLRFLYWNMNYHIEHHMYAAVPYYRLADLRKEIEYDLPEIKNGLWAVWREIGPVVKRQRTEPTYCIVPVVPNPKME